jgi:Fur family transcriptional regulator, ferric uptake regulator
MLAGDRSFCNELHQHHDADETGFTWHSSSRMAARMTVRRRLATPAFNDVRGRLRSRGLRWTPQRRALIDVLRATDGHVTGAELVELCRARDPETTPSTVYRTLEVLEEIGLVKHSHGRDGRQEFHIAPASEHGHAICEGCGEVRELSDADVDDLVASLGGAGFAVDLSHLTVGGLCDGCQATAVAEG